MSIFWDKLSEKHKKMLQNGIEGFRNTVATRYFTDGKHDSEGYIQRIARYVANIDMGDSLFGNPISTEIGGHKVTQDLVNSMFEIEAMGIDFTKIKSICEVGAGYGRTAYVLLKRYPHLKYTIIDIPPALDLAREHLTKEFPNADISFLRAPDKSLGADLYIAISVLTELSKEELADYFKMFGTGKYLYLKDWKTKKNPDNGTEFSEDSFPVKNWKTMFKRDDPITDNFYDAMYEINPMNPIIPHTNPIEYIQQKFGLGGDENPRILKGVNRQELYKLFAELGYTKGCEVGVEKGKNAKMMFENIPGLKLYGVDPYKQHPDYNGAPEASKWNAEYLHHVKHRAKKELRGLNWELIQDFSEGASRKIPDHSLDFVYIDGDHSYDSAMLDIILWSRKVRKGGVVGGHDYFYDKNKLGRQAKVTQVVQDYSKIHDIKFFITDENHYVQKGDYYPSWLWVKVENISPNIVGF